MKMRRVIPACLALLLTSVVQASVGFQTLSIPQDAGEPLKLSLWYPSDATPAETRVGLFMQTVAANAPPAGRSLPLVLISHGTGGSRESHADTAFALAEGGFVVVAVEHPGDNYRDQSGAANIEQRPATLVRAIDHLVDSWTYRAALDTGRIGAFGFSAGGFSVLALAGGRPDMSLVATHCKSHPRQFACGIARSRIAKTGDSHDSHPATPHAASPRYPLKAIVIAAPALGFTFKGGLADVQIPVQLWRADEDEILPAPDYADVVRSALPTPPEFRAVPGAGHYDFLAPCSDALRRIAAPICRSAPGFDRSAFHTEFNAAVVDFFARELTAPAEATAPKL